MKISQDDVVDVCVALGFPTAGSWSKKRMTRKLKDIAKMGTENGLEVEDDERLDSILQAIVQANGEVEIVIDGETELDEQEVPDDVEEDVETGKGKGVVSDEAEEDGEDKDAVDEDDPSCEGDFVSTSLGDAKSELDAAKALVDAAKAKVKEARDEEARVKREKSNGKKRGIPGPKIGGDLKGVRSLRNRLFFAGIVMKRHGLAEGLSDELIDEVDEMAEKPNKKASKGQLASAWHVINGFLNG